MNQMQLVYYSSVKEKVSEGMVDSSLSLGAIGLFNIMGRMFPGIKLTTKFILRTTSDDEQTLHRYLAELIEKGYVVKQLSVVDTSNFGENLGKEG